MASYRIIVDSMEDVEDLSAILTTHDQSGDVDPDDFIKMCAVAAALAYCNSKVSEKDRGDYKVDDFTEQLKRINDKILEYYDSVSYEEVRTSIDLFVSSIATSLIAAISDQSHTPLFSSIKDDLSLVFTVMDGKNETENHSGVSSSI